LKTQSKLGVTLPNKYLIYSAFLYEDEADWAVAEVLENTFNAPIVWERISEGINRGKLDGAFPANKTWVFITQDGNDTFKSSIRRLSDDQVEVSTYLNNILSDNILTATSIEIRVYP